MKNLKLLTTLISFSLFWIGSCSKGDTSTFNEFQLGEAFELEAQEVISETNENISLKVISVLEDSRCPIHVMCVWEGRIKLELEVKKNDQVWVEEIIYQGKEIPLEIGGFTFNLTKITPENQLDEVIELEDYLFTFLIEKT